MPNANNGSPKKKSQSITLPPLGHLELGKTSSLLSDAYLLATNPYSFYADAIMTQRQRESERAKKLEREMMQEYRELMREHQKMKQPKIYVIGSLRNPVVLETTLALEKGLKAEIFSDWLAAGPEADDKWREYEMARGRTYEEALNGYAAKNVFQFDKHHLDTSDAAVLVYPAGKSGHLELGYMAGRGKPTAILLDADYDRWDVMLQFAGIVTKDPNAIIEHLKKELA